MIVEVVFLPSLSLEVFSKLCVVIDELRATSTLAVMFEAGARRVTLAQDPAAALALAEESSPRPLICGESGGLPPQGFDRGNSPREFPPRSLEGKTLVFSTTNGTRAMRRVSDAPVVLSASLFNARAAVKTCLREARERALDIALVCSGDALGTKFAVDDAFCAGHLLAIMAREANCGSLVGPELPGKASMGSSGEPELLFDESAVATLRLYQSYLLEAGCADPKAEPPREAILQAFWESHNAAVLRRVGLAADVEYCAQLDISEKVPRLHLDGGNLVLTCDR